MMLDRHKNEPEPVKELDAIERGDAHVEEDPEDDGVWHESKEWCQEDGQSDENGYAKGGDTLICKRVDTIVSNKIMGFLSLVLK
jgi:hypothetical protein